MEANNSIIIDNIKYVIEKPIFTDASALWHHDNDRTVCMYDESGTPISTVAYLKWNETYKSYEIQCKWILKMFGPPELLEWIHEAVNREAEERLRSQLNEIKK